MKKFLTMLLALVMVFSLSVTAFAADTHSITVTGATGHTYEVYQIFTGDVAKEGESLVLSNVKYGANFGTTQGADVAKDTLKTYADMGGEALATMLNNQKHGDAVATLNADNGWSEDGFAAGYYLIVDVTTNVPDGETKSPLMVKIAGEDLTISSKHASVTSNKKVDDKNDSDNSEDAVNWQDSADYDIGDAVPFKLSAILPTTFNNYTTYELVFHDKQAAGFSNPTITAVYYATADGTKVADIPAAQYALEYNADTCVEGGTCDYGAGCSFSVKFTDLKQVITTYVEGYQVVVEYTSILEDDANIGEIGNENSMYVHHPDGHTPEDTVIVFTYQLNAHKVDGSTEEKVALVGAGFTLYKWDATVTSEDKWVAVGDEIKGPQLTTFTWKGIDDGKYKLVETTTPAGYNTMADLELIITAEHKVVWTKGVDDAAFESVSTDGTTFKDIKNVTIDGTATTDIDGILDGNIENHKGTVLPETGAEGTAMFIGFGSLLTVAAVVFLVTRKKMSIYED